MTVDKECALGAPVACVPVVGPNNLDTDKQRLARCKRAELRAQELAKRYPKWDFSDFVSQKDREILNGAKYENAISVIKKH
jgi:hypothetical protein